MWKWRPNGLKNWPTITPLDGSWNNPGLMIPHETIKSELIGEGDIHE